MKTSPKPCVTMRCLTSFNMTMRSSDHREAKWPYLWHSALHPQPALSPALAQVGDAVALVHQPLDHQYHQRRRRQPAPELLAAHRLAGRSALEPADLRDVQLGLRAD